VLPNYFDEPVAATYDDDEDGRFGAEHLALESGFLAELAGRAGTSGRALELAIGTGRVALPLAARGVEVCGIDLSPAMVDQLRGKPGGGALTVSIGDLTSTRVPGEFDLVYLVFNTIGNVTTQEGQVAVFENAAAHLVPGGRFVVELMVPQLQRVPPGERFHVFSRTEEHVGIDEYDVATQRMWSHHHTFDASGGHQTSVPFRYAWPAELDLMARLAGMQLEHRWADWHRSPYTSDSASHVSVWRQPA
jgi:SAM-dependent methyltransferase